MFNHLSRITTAVITLAAWLLFASPSAFAQQSSFQDPLLDHMVGQWTLTGNVMGEKVTRDVDAEWVMGHQYLRIHEVSRDKKADGQPTYESMMFIGWNAPPGEYSIVGLDTYGSIVPGSFGLAPRSGNPIHFVYKEGKGFWHYLFAYTPKDDTWTLQGSLVVSGKSTPYVSVSLARQASAN